MLNDTKLPLTVTITAPNKIPYVHTYTPVSEMLSPKLWIWNISPNPTEGDKIYVEIRDENGEIDGLSYFKEIALLIYSTEGNLEKIVQLPKNENSISIPCDRLKSGTHLLLLVVDSQVFDSKRFVVL